MAGPKGGSDEGGNLRGYFYFRQSNAVEYGNRLDNTPEAGWEGTVLLGARFSLNDARRRFAPDRLKHRIFGEPKI